MKEITEKTSLLSINAAIEAARAGTSGAGFSVVAGEIRTLSSASKEKLDSSFQKIEGMQTSIDKSRSLSQEVSGSLTEIIDNTKISTGKISSMTNGQVLKMLADDPGSEPDMRGWAKTTGNDLLKVEKDGNNFIFYIKKTED